jgi:phosphomannomutase
VSVRLARVELARQRVRELGASPPSRLGETLVRSSGPLRTDAVELPPDEGLALHLDGGRVLIRPSGTEPTVKAYLELVREVDAGTLPVVRRATTMELNELESAVRELLGSG